MSNDVRRTFSPERPSVVRGQPIELNQLNLQCDLCAS